MSDQLIKIYNQFASKDTSSARIKGMIKVRKASIARKPRLSILLDILLAS